MTRSAGQTPDEAATLIRLPRHLLHHRHRPDRACGAAANLEREADEFESPFADDHLLELTFVERKRIFNLGYYTWVEQQGISIEDFDRRKSQDFWRGLVDTIPAWDRMIEDFNDEVSGANA